MSRSRVRSRVLRNVSPSSRHLGMVFACTSYKGCESWEPRNKAGCKAVHYPWAPCLLGDFQGLSFFLGVSGDRSIAPSVFVFWLHGIHCMILSFWFDERCEESNGSIPNKRFYFLRAKIEQVLAGLEPFVQVRVPDRSIFSAMDTEAPM